MSYVLAKWRSTVSDSPSLCIAFFFSFGNTECYRLCSNLFLYWFIIIEKWCFTLNSCMRMLTIWVYIYAARKRENKLNFKLLLFSHSNRSCCVLFCDWYSPSPKAILSDDKTMSVWSLHVFHLFYDLIFCERLLWRYPNYRKHLVNIRDIYAVISSCEQESRSVSSELLIVKNTLLI